MSQNASTFACVITLLICTFSAASQQDARAFQPDISIGPFRLHDPSNVERLLGPDPIKSDAEAYQEYPNAKALNANGTELLTLYVYNGSLENEISLFKISHVNTNDQRFVITQLEEFTTESGVHLGMSYEELVSLKGAPHEAIGHYKMITAKYRLDDADESEFLKKYNMPIYYADYHFLNGRLIEFTFGFEYP